MTDDKCKAIFRKNTELIGIIDKMTFYLREQQFDKAFVYIAETIDYITYLVEAIVTDREYFENVSTQALLEMVNHIIEAKKNKDYVLLADLYEMKLINFLNSIQSFIMKEEVFTYNEESYKDNIIHLAKSNPSLFDSLMEELNPESLLARGYRVELTSCGLMTLAAENRGDSFYFHTNNRVIFESFLLANHWFKEGIQCYIIYGFGFGYHIAELRKLAKSAKIEIYESDSNILQLACAFTDMSSLLDDPDIRIIYDPEYYNLKERLHNLNERDAFEIHYPSYKNVKNRKIIEMLESYLPWSKMLEYC
jgi:hypothetical protein